MSLLLGEGTLMTTTALADALSGHIGPAPQIDIPLSPQHEDAWCYAACAEMVINFCEPAGFVTQCEVAGFVKNTDCCGEIDNQLCLESGCRKDQIVDIFTNFDVHSERLGPIDLATLESQILGDETIGRPPSPVEVVIDWLDEPGSHAVLVTGVLGDLVYIVDPLEDQDHGGWQDITFLQNGFGYGAWVDSWLGLRKGLI